MSNNMRVLNEDAILNDWAPLIQEKTKIEDPYKINWMAKMCNIQALNESSNAMINESFSYPAYASLTGVPGMNGITAPSTLGTPSNFYTGTNGSGDKFPTLLPIAIQIAARTVGFDVVSVIPMNSPVAMLAYMDYVYAGGKLDSAQAPIMIKINAGLINSVAYVVGTTYWGISALPDNTNYTLGTYAVELVFVGLSKIDGYPIFRIGSKYIMTGTTNGKTADTTTVTIASIFDGSGWIKTDSSGPSVSNSATTYVSVSATADLVRAFEDHIFGPSGAGETDTDNWTGPWTDGTDAMQPMTRTTGESTYYRTLGIKLFSKFVEAKTEQFAALVKTKSRQPCNHFQIYLLS